MTLTVEFFGPSRRLAGVSKSLIEVDQQASFRAVMQCLASRFPALVGPVVDPQTHDLVSSYLLNLNGRRVVKDLDAEIPQGQQRLLLMFAEAGG